MCGSLRIPSVLETDTFICFNPPELECPGYEDTLPGIPYALRTAQEAVEHNYSSRSTTCC